MKKQMTFIVALLLSACVYSQCSIYGDFHYYAESTPGYYCFYDVSYGLGLTPAAFRQWKVNGVNAPNGTANILHYQFPSSGTYTVCEYITDPTSGCTFPAICKTLNIIICPAVSPNFNWTNNGGNNYTFTNTSTGTVNPTYYSWTINGNVVSTASSFSYTFTSAGSHHVVLVVTSGGCTFQGVGTWINVAGCPTINQNWYYSTTNGATYTFTDGTTGTLSNPTYTWKLNGTTFATTPNTNHTFANQGLNTICEVITANSCTYVPLCMDFYICPPINMNVSHSHVGFTYTFNDISTKLNGNPLGGPLTRYWSINGVDQSNHNGTFSYTFPGPGTYEICLDLLDNQCYYLDYCNNLTVQTSDVPEYMDESEINIFPNPVQQELNLKTGVTHVYAFEIIDFSGKVVLKKSVSENNDFSINTQELAPGIYSLKLETESGTIIKKIVKQ